jgi:hypothetical protein
LRVHRLLACAASALAVATSAQAATAPRDTATLALNGKRVSIEYGRPALRGRSVDQLLAQLPADRIWRAGIDQVTTLTTETDLMVGGKKVAAGAYTVYLFAPRTGPWSLVLNADHGVPMSEAYSKGWVHHGHQALVNPPAAQALTLWPHLEGYQTIATREVARASLKAVTSVALDELFTIRLEPASAGANVLLSWGDRHLSAFIRPAE